MQRQKARTSGTNHLDVYTVCQEICSYSLLVGRIRLGFADFFVILKGFPDIICFMLWVSMNQQNKWCTGFYVCRLFLD